MQTEWDPGELIGAWTLVEGNWDLIANKAGVTRLGFTVMLKFYEIEGRFPAYPEEVPPAAARVISPNPRSRASSCAENTSRVATYHHHHLPADDRRHDSLLPP